MIKTENLTINGRPFIRTYSDSGYMVERDGVRYDEAYDPAELGRIYTETQEPAAGMSETEQKARAFDILMGVAE